MARLDLVVPLFLSALLLTPAATAGKPSGPTLEWTQLQLPREGGRVSLTYPLVFSAE